MPPRTRYTKSGTLSIAYQVSAGGPIDLVQAHGWISNVEYAWENPDCARFMTRLGTFSRFIRFDRRGMGLSDRDVTSMTLEERVDDIRAVMDAAGSERAALLGVSEGGYMSLMFAATHPERTTALVLYGCYARSKWARGLIVRRAWGAAVEVVRAAPIPLQPLDPKFLILFLRLPPRIVRHNRARQRHGGGGRRSSRGLLQSPGTLAPGGRRDRDSRI